MSERSRQSPERRAELIEAAGLLGPDLHRYCARLMGSAFEGEDVVQDTLERALAAFDSLTEPSQLRSWLFRIAHNRALDLLKARSIRTTEPIEAASEVPDADAVDPLESAIRQETVQASFARFLELNAGQRSVVILKDVLGESLLDIADLLNLTLDSVKAHLARGRARLRELDMPSMEARPPVPSAAVSNYANLFNARDWEALRALLADDVKLRQSSRPIRVGRHSVGGFFSTYARLEPVHLVPGWMDGREVIAVFEKAAEERPGYVMWLEWRDGRITFIHDYRYAGYVLHEAGLHLSGHDGT